MSYHFSLNDLLNHFEENDYYDDEYYVVRSRLSYQLENDFEGPEDEEEENLD